MRKVKCYKFILNKWACPKLANRYRKILRDWVIENDYEITPLLVKDDVYVYATDKDVLHMVITDPYWEDLPRELSFGEDILEFLMDAVENRDDDDDDIEEKFLDYLTE